MAKSLATITRQIEELQKQATVIKAKEVQGVIARIKEAITAYDLKPADLFQAPRQLKSKAKDSKNIPRKPKSAVKAKKAPRPAKYADGTGNSWTGHGKRPAWFKAALESGKTLEDLTVKS